MPSSFSKYTGGIAPVQGLFEMGASIGKNYAAGITAAAENITKGVGDYYKMVGEAQYADSELDSAGEKYTALASMLGSEPETAHLVEGITPILETIKKGRSGSHNAKLSAVAQVGAQGKALTETFQYMGLVRNAKERRLFNEANVLPPTDEEVTTKSFGLNTKDTQWSPNLSYTANVERVKGNYRKWLDLHKDELASGKFRVMSEDDFLKDWKRRLPSSIQNSGLAEQDKAWAMDIINQNQLLEGMSDEDMGAQGYFMQDWATINPYRGSGGINAVNAPAGTVAQEPTASTGKPHPNAVALRDENDRLIAEAKRIQSRVGKSWFGGNDDEDRARAKEIIKQIESNNIIINSLGGAPSSSEIRKAEAGRSSPVPQIVLDEGTDEESPVLAPPPVPVAPRVVAPAPVTPRVVAPAPVAPRVVAPVAPRVVAPAPVVIAPPKVQEENAVVEVPALPEPQYTETPSVVAPVPAPIANADSKTSAYAAELGWTPEELISAAQENNMTPEEFYKGLTKEAQPEKTQIKPFTPSPMPQRAKPSANERPPASTPTPDAKYVVKKGMTLSTIAKAAGVATSALAKANGLNLNHDFGGGEIIFIPPTREMNKAVDRAQDSPEPIAAPISRAEAEGGMPDTENEGTPPPSGYIDKDTGNLVINTPITGDKPTPDEDIEGEGIDTGQFEPIKLKPIGTRPTGGVLPELPQQVKASYSSTELEDIKLAARHIQEVKAEVESQQRSVDPAIKYLEAIRENVIDGDGTAVDYGTYGKWEKLNPDAAGAINTAAQAGALWYGGGWGKTIKFANSIEKVDFVARKSKIAREAATRIIDGIRKSGRIETPEEIARAVSVGMKQAGLANKQLSKELLYEGVGRVGGSITKSSTWSAIINQMVGNEPYSVGDDINNKTIKEELATVLEDIRRTRQDNGGYSVIPFNSKPISEIEIRKIRKILDTKIAGLRQISEQNAAQIDSINKNTTPQNLLRLSKELEKDSNAQLAAQEIATANGLYDDPSAGIPTEDYGEIEIGGQAVASKDFVVPQSNESRKKQMMEYMKSRLGYIPDGFEDMWRKNHPESTLQIKETPYGVFYSDKTGEWKQMTSTGGKQLQPHEVAANRAVQFGNLQPDGTYTPTEFIAGSGIKLGGIGTFGTPSDATKFRMEYTRKIKALRYADELRQINEITFRSMMPSQWGKSKAKVAALVAQMRQELIGVGSVSDFEQKLLKDLVADPTDFFRLQSTVRATYEELIDKLARSLVEDPQTYGIEVQMPKDKQAQLKNMRAIYLSQQERYKAKMTEFEKQEQK